MDHGIGPLREELLGRDLYAKMISLQLQHTPSCSSLTMDDFLDHTANVTVSFSIIEVSERRWSFVEPSVRSENRSSTFSGWVKQVSYDGKDCWRRNVVDDGETTPWGEQNQPAS
jgi:hypothetical protein